MGKIPILTNIFQRGWFNHQLEGDFLTFMKPHSGCHRHHPDHHFFMSEKKFRASHFFPRMRIGIREGNWDEDPMKIWGHTVDG